MFEALLSRVTCPCATLYNQNECKRFHNKVEEGRQMDFENRKAANDNERDSLKTWHEQSKGEIEKVLLSILQPNRGSAAV